MRPGTIHWFAVLHVCAVLALLCLLMMQAGAWSDEPVVATGGTGAVATDVEAKLMWLRQVAPEVERKHPLAGKWLAAQFEILARIEQNAQADAALVPADPLRVESQRQDRRYMIGRLSTLMQAVLQAPDKGNDLVNVRDFGAKGDGVTDDAAALRTAIAEAIRTQRGGVYLPAGQYLIKQIQTVTYAAAAAIRSEDEGELAGQAGAAIAAHLVLAGVENFTIRGDGQAELLLGNPLARGMVLSHCKNVTLQNLRLEYRPLPYCQGRIVHIEDDKRFDVALDPGFPAPTEPFFAASNTHGISRTYSEETLTGSARPALSSVGPHSSYKRVEHLQDNRYRFTLDPERQPFVSTNQVRVGLQFAYYARMYGNMAVVIRSSERCTLQRVEVCSSPAMAFLIQGTDAVFLDHCQVREYPGSNRFVSTSADGVFLHGNNYGSYVRDCTFRYLGDDFLNIHALFHSALEAEGDTLYFPPGGWDAGALREGFRLGLVKSSAMRGAVEAEAVIRSVALVGRADGKGGKIRVCRVVLDRPLPPVKTLTNLNAGERPDQLVVLENFSHGFVLENNRFENGLSRFLIGGRNGIFRNNVILDSLSSSELMHFGGVSLGNQGGEAMLPRNVLVMGNRILTNYPKKIFHFINNSYGGNATTDRVLSHIDLLQNRVGLFTAPSDPSCPVFRVRNADAITIAGNQILAPASSTPLRLMDRLAEDSVTDKENTVSSWLPPAFPDHELREDEAAQP